MEINLKLRLLMTMSNSKIIMLSHNGTSTRQRRTKLSRLSLQTLTLMLMREMTMRMMTVLIKIEMMMITTMLTLKKISLNRPRRTLSNLTNTIPKSEFQQVDSTSQI